MKFLNSGLPQDVLTEKAFNHSYNNVMKRAPEVLEDYSQNIENAYKANMKKLDHDRDARANTDKPMPLGEYEAHRMQINKMREAQLQRGPDLIKAHLESLFQDRRLGLAKAVAENASNPSPELLSASLLVECVHSPIDFKELQDLFGDDVADIVAGLLHLDAYPSERAENAKIMSSNVKTLYASTVVSSLTTILEKIDQSKKSTQAPLIRVPPGQEAQIFKDMNMLWGNDPKLDHRFVALFNRFAEETKSPYRVELNDKGTMDLVKGALPKAPKAPETNKDNKEPNSKKPPNNNDFGGNVF